MIPRIAYVRGAGAALAAAALMGAAAPALADTTIITAAVGHSQQDFFDPTIIFANTGNSKRAGAGVSNGVEDGVFAPPIDGNHFLDSGLNAFYAAPNDLANNASGRGFYGVLTNNFLLIQDLSQPGIVDLASEALVSATDQVTITGAPGDNRQVIFHTALEVETPQGPDHQTFDTFDANTDFTASGHTQIRLNGTGIGLSDQGNDVFYDTTVSADPFHNSVRTLGTLPNPAAFPLIPVDVLMTLGQATAFSLNLDDTTSMSIDDRRGNLEANFRLDDAFFVGWSGQVSVTDANTGETLCGLSIGSAEGENFGSVAACSGGGGGVAGVPEPANWALMIAGFGLCGAALRRRGGLVSRP